jgi:hypothetical protein
MKTKKKSKFNLELLLLLAMFFLSIAVYGFLMNVHAVESNGCKMPVKMDYFYEGERHKSFSNCSDINSCWMTDILKVADTYFSFGDILIYAGTLGVLISYGSYFMMRLLKSFRKKHGNK